MVPCVPEGVYAELRIYMNCRWRVVKELVARENQIQRRLKIYFPEYSEIFSSVSGAGSMALLHWVPLPRDLLVLGADGIDQIWRQQKLWVVEKNGHKGRLMRRKRASAARKVLKKTQEKLRLYMEERVLC